MKQSLFKMINKFCENKIKNREIYRTSMGHFEFDITENFVSIFYEGEFYGMFNTLETACDYLNVKIHNYLIQRKKDIELVTSFQKYKSFY